MKTIYVVVWEEHSGNDDIMQDYHATHLDKVYTDINKAESRVIELMMDSVEYFCRGRYLDAMDEYEHKVKRIFAYQTMKSDGYRYKHKYRNLDLGFERFYYVEMDIES